ncbi:unnamed protein product, partial [Staurois parvus]
MQLPVISCTFLTLSQREESTADSRQLSEEGSALISRTLMISALMIVAQQCHPPVPPTSAQQCHPPVSSSATHLCPPVPSSATLPSATHLCRLSMPPHQHTSVK